MIGSGVGGPPPTALLQLTSRSRVAMRRRQPRANFSAIAAVLTLVFWFSYSLFALAKEISVGSDTRINKTLRSVKALRDKDLVRQQSDYSCGAAALATILRYGFGENVTEREILVQLFDLLSEEDKIVSRREGFSLRDLQRVAQARHYKAEGFRLDARDLSTLGGPVIVFIQPRGYKHFAVLRGVKGDRMYLADPSRGNIRVPTYTFLEQWLQDDGKGIIFVVEPETGVPAGVTPLALGNGQRRTELMSTRELLNVTDTLMQLPRTMKSQ